MIHIINQIPLPQHSHIIPRPCFNKHKMHDFRLPPWSSWDLHSLCYYTTSSGKKTQRVVEISYHYSPCNNPGEGSSPNTKYSYENGTSVCVCGPNYVKHSWGRFSCSPLTWIWNDSLQEQCTQHTNSSLQGVLVHPFHRHLQNATIRCHSQELLPFLSVTYFILPPFSTNYSTILSHIVLPSISSSTSQSCCSLIHI